MTKLSDNMAEQEVAHGVDIFSYQFALMFKKTKT